MADLTLTSESILGRLQNLHPKAIDLSLDRIERLLDQMGNPHHKLPPIVHVAGTNGKGSTVAFIRAMLEAAGYRVHVYTSPHLVRFNERIRLAGEEIDDPTFTEILEECESVNAGEPITLFEITSVAAFLAFSRVPADVLLLEVGLGGRFDTTNVIDKPIASVITPVSMDHTAFLGDTIEKIAFEKAGILKPGVPGIVGPQGDEAQAVLAARAAEINAPLTCFGRDFSGALEGGGYRFTWRGEVEVLTAKPGLPGDHQILNAATALATIHTISDILPTNAEQRAAGLANVSWPARMQRLNKGPLVDMMPDGWSLWLDGGHNEDAGRVVADHLKSWREQEPSSEIHVIVGMLNTKEPGDYLAHFKDGVVDTVAAVAIPGESASLSARDVRSSGTEIGLDVSSEESVESALQRAFQNAGPNGRVLISGSLYLAGRVLAENG